MGLARLIEEHRQEVLVRWKEMVRTLREARHLSESGLENHIPDLLDWLGARLDGPSSADEGGGYCLSRVHAFERLEQDFDLMAVLAEFGVLREVLLGLWLEEPKEVTPREVVQLNRDMDDVVTVCTTEFARQVLARHGLGSQASHGEHP